MKKVSQSTYKRKEQKITQINWYELTTKGVKNTSASLGQGLNPAVLLKTTKYHGMGIIIKIMGEQWKS